MKKQTFIYIQEPCHENWNSMSAEVQGRFCHSCAKTVTDFSGMTDAEILKYLSTASGNTCGRFSPDQLNRAITTPATAAKKTFWAYLLSLFIPILVNSRLNAQKPANKVNTEQLQTKPAKLPAEATPHVATVSDTTRLTNSADTTGNTAMEGEMKMEPVVMGLIIQYDKVNKTDTVATIAKKVTNNELFRIYPNPAVKGKKASVQINKTGEYEMQLLDLDSKMIVYKTVRVNSKRQMVFLDIPSSVASGNYYLRLVHKATKQQFTDKLIIQ